MSKKKFQKIKQNLSESDIKRIKQLLLRLSKEGEIVFQQLEETKDVGELMCCDSVFCPNINSIGKELFHLIGIENTYVITEILEKEYHSKKHGEIRSDGYFKFTVQELEDNIGFNDYKQRTCLKELKELGMIDFKQLEIPAKRYIKTLYDETDGEMLHE